MALINATTLDVIRIEALGEGALTAPARVFIAAVRLGPRLVAALEGLVREPTLAETIAAARQPDLEFGRDCPQYLEDLASIRNAADAAEAILAEVHASSR